MSDLKHTVLFRVRYSEVDSMGSYYNSRALEWFEHGRSELCRAAGMPYGEMEQRGIRLPLSETYAKFTGRAGYDDQLEMTSTLALVGRVRLRFDVEIRHAATGRPVCHGHTIHAVVNTAGKPIRPPSWLVELIGPR